MHLEAAFNFARPESRTTQLILGLAYVMAWQGYRARSRVGGLGQVAILGALFCSLASVGIVGLHNSAYDGDVGMVWMTSHLNRWNVNGIRYAFDATTSAFLLLLRLSIDRNVTYTFRSRPVLILIAAWAVVEATLAAIALFAIPRQGCFGYGPSFDCVPAFIYRLIRDAWSGGINAVVAVYLWRYAREEGTGIRWGLRMVSAALTVAVVLAIIRTGPMVVHYLGGPTWKPSSKRTLRPIGAIWLYLTILGLSLPFLLGRWHALVRWFRIRSMETRIDPLWRLSVQAHPALMLRDRGRDPLRKRDECFDTLTFLVSGASTDRSPQADAAADLLRTVIARYDAQNPDATVAETLSPTVPEKRPRRPGEPDPVTLMVLALADLAASEQHADTVPSSSSA